MLCPVGRPFLQFFSYILFKVFKGFKLANVLCKLVVKVGQFLFLYFLDVHLEHRFLARQVLRMVVLRESDLYLDAVPGLCTDKLVLKALDEMTRAQHQRLVLGGAAFKLLFADKALVVDYDHVVLLRGPAFHRHHPGVCVPHVFQFLIHVFVCNRIFLFLHPYAFIIAEDNLRFYRDNRFEYERLALLKLYYVNLRPVHRMELVLVHRRLVGFGAHLVYRVLVEHALAVVPLNNYPGRLSLSETGYIEPAHVFLVCLLDTLFKLLLAYFYLQCGGILLYFLQLGIHICSSLSLRSMGTLFVPNI